MRCKRLVIALLLAPASQKAADAAELQIAKSTTVAADKVNAINPRALPGSEIDIALVVTNPAVNALVSVRHVVIVDTIPTTLQLRVTDYGAAGSGPVSFTDGNLLGLGLLGSGLAFAYAGLGSGTDGLEFSDGTSWSYTPVPDAAGFDARVRGIRVTMAGTQGTGSAFRLVYRTALK